MIINQIRFLLVALLLSGCQTNGQGQSKGQALITSYYYSQESGKVVDSVYFRIWWDGNQSIQQVPLILFEEDSAGNRKDTVLIDHYSFLDSKKNVCYNYKQFSDTAKILKAYSNIDSVDIGGGWNYLTKQRLRFDKAFRQGDTIINGENLQRLSAHRSEGKNHIDFFMYMNCDMELGNVRLYKHLSDSIGCTIVRNDTYVNDKIYTSKQLLFVSDKLTADEIKVFEAWSKNVNQTPCKKE